MHILRRYPKMLLFVACCVVAYTLGHAGAFDWIADQLNTGGYLTVFLAGLLFSFGFTTPFAIGLFIAIAPTVEPLHAAILGGAGALLSDLTIFSFARVSLKTELHRLSLTHWARNLFHVLHREAFPQKLRRWMLWLTAGLVIASPLPDEIGVTMLSGITNIEGRRFAVICYMCNTVGILAILLAAH